MTHIEKFRTATEDEIIDILLANIDVDDLCVGYCSEACSHRHDKYCSEPCRTKEFERQMVRWWLNKESTEC